MIFKEEEGLYDLIYDSGERNNLIHFSEHQEILSNLRTRLMDHLDPILQG